MRRAAAVVLLVAFAACSRGGGSPVKLDGTPRSPDAEGVVTAVSSRRITLDGKATYDVPRDVQSFSATTLAAIPLAAREGTYVQLGLDGREVQWIAGFSAAVEFPERGAIAFHNGTLRKIDDGKATFEDGSVLRVRSGVAKPPKGARVTAEIDVAKKAISRFTPGAAVERPAAP